MKINFGTSLPQRTQNLINAIIPGLGFFGATDASALLVDINMEIDEIELAIEAIGPEILNIRAIDFYDSNDRIISRNDIAESVSLSSVSGNEDNNQYHVFVKGGMLHTKLEKRPHVAIKLRSRLFIKRISIKNRPDIYGYRSRNLIVSARFQGNEVFHFRNISSEKAKAELEFFMKLAGLDADGISDDSEIQEFMLTFRQKIIDDIQRERLQLSLRQICTLLPLYTGYPSITDFHIILCANALVNAWSGKILNTIFLKTFRNVLSSDFALDRLKRKAEELIELHQKRNANVVIAKHHIQESYFLERKERFLSAMENIITALRRENITAIIGYGTLLGAVREGSFLPHDDDVDLIVFDGSASQEQAIEGKIRLIDVLENNGIHVRPNEYWHLHAVSNGMTVDIFPGWKNEGGFYLPMEHLKIRPVPVADMLPTTEVKLYERSFPAPANSAAFLENRYGAGWQNSDPYYEWSWKIDRIVSGLSQKTLEALENRDRIVRRHLGRICRVAWGQKVKKGEISPPQNCMHIIDLASECGYDAVELDVRITKDSIPVLAHDAVLHFRGNTIDIKNSELDEVARFKIGRFQGEDVFVPTLFDALKQARDMDVQIDSRITADQVEILRTVVDQAQFDPTRLQFCVYNVEHAQALLQHFPESVLLWKTYRGFLEVDDYFLDEAKALGMDGIMIQIPQNREVYAALVHKLRKRNLRVLMFIHSDDEEDLMAMAQYGVDYVTTVAHSTKTFQLIGRGIF